MNNHLNKAIVKLMVTIVDRGKGEKITEIYKEQHIHFHFLCFGLGTTSSEILDYLGLGETEKDVIISLAPHWKESTLLTAISENMHTKHLGKGIVFTLPISGIGSLISSLLTQEERIKIESEVTKMEKNSKYVLILAIINQGFTDLVMEPARAAGATGGTVLHSRGLGFEEAEKFLGISIQSEKEIVAILCKREEKHGIMQAINQAAGLKTEAKGILLSLSVDETMGIG